MNDQETIAQLRAENARLAAVCRMAYEKLGWLKEYVEYRDSINVALIELAKGADSTTLRDLLKPTVELLRREVTLRNPAWNDGWNKEPGSRYHEEWKLARELDAELSRLEALTK